MKTKSELLELLKFHDQEQQRIDNELAAMCKTEIQTLVDSGRFEDAKAFVKEFYKGYSDYSFEKDLILANINRQLVK